jgi:hypothetical protein
MDKKSNQESVDRAAFERNELVNGCGYWGVCDDHACPCSPTAKVSRGFDPGTYARMRENIVQMMYYEG